MHPREGENGKVVATIQDALSTTLAGIAPRLERYALLDFPNHSNVGDSAIYLGELALLEKLYGAEPRYVSEMDADGLGKIVPPGPENVIFLHGGGNFGDLWPTHQKFREQVIRDFAGHRIVQLPQTIHFADKAALERSRQIINDHPDFTLLVRDRTSLEIARQNFSCPVHLCPDSAFMLGMLEPRASSGDQPLFLLRTDKEASGLARERVNERMPVARIEDWLGEPSVKSRRQRLEGQLQRRVPAARALLRSRRQFDYRDWATKRLERGLRQLSSARIVVTDRLHAHILCVLLGKPHIVLDNFYGKVRSFADAWTGGANFSLARDLDEAIDLVEAVDEPSPQSA